jgi:UDP-3-O-[3-hydroxymyristoyl] glucosamine N-acyltransferase
VADKRFFPTNGPITLQAVAALTGAAIVLREKSPDSNKTFADVAPLESAGPEHISFFDNVKYMDAFTASKAGACFVRPKYTERAPAGMVCLVTEDPYSCYALTAQKFYPGAFEPGVSPGAHVAKTAKLGKGVRIDAGAVIGDNVEIGDGSWIGSCSTVTHAIIGRNCIVHRGVHIGQDGFGFAPSKKGLIKVPQLGRVVIGDGVEIGSGTCIDRGAGPDTVIGDFCKIDNLVQIAHNVKLGKFVVIAAQVGISGSTEVGDGTMLGGQTGIAGHLKIGKGVKIAAQSGVMNDVPDGATWGGAPALPIKDWHRQTIAVSRIARKGADNE